MQTISVRQQKKVWKILIGAVMIGALIMGKAPRHCTLGKIDMQENQQLRQQF
jgi:hypothetical protein